MPRVFTPRTVGDPGELVTDTVPQIDEIAAAIGTWDHEPHTGDGSTAYRVIGAAPEAGTVVYAFFVPDVSVSTDPDKRWLVHLINAGDDGTGTTEITDVLSTGFALTALEPVDFDEAALPPNTLTPDPLVVAKNDLIVWRAVQEIDAGAEDNTASARPTGHVTVGIRRSGGS